MPRTSQKRDSESARDEEEEESSLSPAKKRIRTTIRIPSALDIGRRWKPPISKAAPAAKTTIKAARKISSKNTFKQAEPEKPTSVATELSSLEACLWSEPYAAKAAVKCHNPGRKVRHVGTITREVHVDRSKDPFPSMVWKKKDRSKLFVPSKNVQPPRAFKSPSESHAKMMALKHVPHAQDTTDGRVILQAHKYIQQWKSLLGEPYSPNWDEAGELLECPLEGALRVSQVLPLIKDQTLRDDKPGLSRSYYTGLREICIDTESVLHALVNFGKPDSVYSQQPYVFSYIIPQVVKQAALINTYQLTIPVYAHRLAFEMLSVSDYHTIWSALDENSYNVARSLASQPKLNSPVFFSAETPRVVMEDESDTESVNDEEDGDELLQSSTRRSDVISAYSFPGLFKLLESSGNDISIWPSLESKLKGKLRVDLLPHQVHGICWMIQQEQIEGGLNSLLWEERKFVDGKGSYFFSPAVGQIRLNLTLSEGKGPPPVGGIMADEMGLGKTVQMLALILATKDERDEHPTTLIVVPPALLTQWKSEVKKITGDHLVTEVFDVASLSFQPAFEEQSKEGQVDLVLTTYAALSTPKAATSLKQYTWKRIVLDEMQEIRSCTTKLAQNCQELSGHRRWMLSGTPLFESIQDFRGELCFLGLEPFAATSDDGFFDFCITQHWEARSHFGLDSLRALSLVMLRRSKTMTYLEPTSQQQLPLLGLPPLTVTLEPVPQHPSERAIYCYLEYLVHSILRHEEEGEDAEDTDNKGCHRDEGKRRLFLRLLREACFSGHLLSGGLGCSTSLDTLDRIVVQHNRRSPSFIENEQSRTGAGEVLSINQAIEFLSRVVDTARVEDGFQTNLVVGGGMGRSRRVRAYESLDEKIYEAKHRLQTAQNKRSVAIARRAKIRWHCALELITTGSLELDAHAAGSSIRRLWRWKRLTIALARRRGAQGQGLPVWLCRGWRPTTNFFRSKSFYRAQENWRKILLRIVHGEALQTITPFLGFDCSGSKENSSRNDIRYSYKDTESDNKTANESSRRCHALWRWRFVLKHFDKASKVLTFSLLDREDRSYALFRLASGGSRPNLRWAHPTTIFVDNIPQSVSMENLHGSITEASVTQLQGDRARESLWISVVRKTETVWSAYVRFHTHADFKEMIDRVGRDSKGLALSHGAMAWVEEEEQQAAEALKDALAANKVYPCDANIQKYAAAKRAHKLAKLGLRMHAPAHWRAGHVLVRRAFENMRCDSSQSSWTLLERSLGTIESTIDEISSNTPVILSATRMVDRLEKVKNQEVPSNIQNLSTFEVFEALKTGHRESTSCPVCLCPLGGDEQDKGRVALTRCGHLFCAGCLQGYFKSKLPNASPSCIACRKEITQSGTVLVDPDINDDIALEKKRRRAKLLVREASDMLEDSRGHLEPHLWEAMYLSFDPPKNVSQSRHATYTNIPGEFLAHLRQITGLQLTPRQKRDPDMNVESLSTKIQKLLKDLPEDERSVVFATSNTAVKHLSCILSALQYHVRALFTGQNEVDARRALDDWRSAVAGVLVVQSGAAACGLTLTDASKMFLMEPFLRYEEEQQAYSRLHRYGQTKEVQCTVYYAPVSVESRLLEWRKKKSPQDLQGETVIFAQLKSACDEADEEDGEQTQARYLLGLDLPNTLNAMEMAS